MALDSTYFKEKSPYDLANMIIQKSKEYKELNWIIVFLVWLIKDLDIAKQNTISKPMADTLKITIAKTIIDLEIDEENNKETIKLLNTALNDINNWDFSLSTFRTAVKLWIEKHTTKKEKIKVPIIQQEVNHYAWTISNIF